MASPNYSSSILVSLSWIRFHFQERSFAFSSARLRAGRSEVWSASQRFITSDASRSLPRRLQTARLLVPRPPARPGHIRAATWAFTRVRVSLGGGRRNETGRRSQNRRRVCSGRPERNRGLGRWLAGSAFAAARESIPLAVQLLKSRSERCQMRLHLEFLLEAGCRGFYARVHLDSEGRGVSSCRLR